jgi:hypothetical protein
MYLPPNIARVIITLKTSKQWFANATTVARKKKYFPTNSIVPTLALVVERQSISPNVKYPERERAFPRADDGSTLLLKIVLFPAHRSMTKHVVLQR